ncbi:MAG: CARDB domain-containing protein, partial [Candidatus Bipolaricaulia bacterium]
MGRKAGVVILTLFLGLMIGLAGSGEQGGLPELHLQKLVLEPPSPVVRGEAVQVHAWVMNTGERPAGEFKVEFFYRPGRAGESWISFHVVLVSNLAPSQQEALEVKDDGQAIMIDTADLELGTYEIRVVADSNNQIPEEDETNNELVTTLTVLPSRLGLADLQPVTLAIDPPSPTSGQLVVVSTEIRNTGDKDAGPFRVSFLIDDQEFDSANLEGLAAGASISAQGALDPYALGLRPGSHKLLVIVDADGQIEEQDEVNNELAAALTIQGAELHPTSLQLDRALVRLDSRTTVSSKVANTGKGVADRVEVGFYIDGMQFALAEVGPLGPGETATAQGELIPAKPELGLAPGEHELRVVVDPNGLVPELDEANNELVKSLTILPPEPQLPELHPESLTLNPPSPVELGTTEAVTVSSVIANTGRASAEGFSVEFSYRAKGTLRWEPLPCRDQLSCQGLTLAPGAELKIEGSLSITGASPGIYELRVVVDPPQDPFGESGTGQVAELDETNNEFVTTLSLLSSRLADLAFDPTLPLEVAPAYQVNRGQTLRFTAHLMNMGDLAAGPFEVEFAYCRLPETTPQGTQEQPCTQPTDFITFSVVSLAGLEVGKGAGAQAILETTSLRPGSYLIRVAVDPTSADRPTGNVAEQSEANNLLDISVLIQGADLIPIGLELSPPSPVVQGEVVEVTATILNVGVEPTGKFDVNLYWCLMITPKSCSQPGEFNSFGRVVFPGIAVNNPEEATVEWNTGRLELGGGTYLIKVLIDPQDQVPEQNELNNELISQKIQVVAKPDLVPLAIELRPGHAVVQGEVVTASATLTNSGYVDAPELKISLFYRAVGEEAWVPFDRSVLPGLGVGEQATIIGELETEKLDPGDYELKAVLDPERAIDELSKENNEIATDLRIEPQPADLVVQPPLVFEPQPPVPAGQPVKVYATVANGGGRPADEFRVAFLYRKVKEGGGQELVEFDSATIPGLEPGAEATALGVLDTSVLAGGTYEICVLADGNNQVAELDEANNRYCTPPPFMLISPPPDLQPKPQLTFDPTPPVEAGQSVKVYATVANSGGSPAGKFRVVFLVDDREFDSAVVSGLEPGEEA